VEGVLEDTGGFLPSAVLSLEEPSTLNEGAFVSDIVVNSASRSRGFIEWWSPREIADVPTTAELRISKAEQSMRVLVTVLNESRGQLSMGSVGVDDIVWKPGKPGKPGIFCAFPGFRLPHQMIVISTRSHTRHTRHMARPALAYRYGH